MLNNRKVLEIEEKPFDYKNCLRQLLVHMETYLDELVIGIT